MNILIYDTETTGLLLKEYPLGHPSQPRIVQLAAVLVNTADWMPQGVLSLLVKPDGFTIPANAEAVHHISNARAATYGVAISYALHIFITLVHRAEVCYAFNADYDTGVIIGELMNLKRNDDIKSINNTKCVMKPLTNICKIKSAWGFKWPTLDEAYTHYFGEPPKQAHDALADVHTTMKVLQAYLGKDIK